MGTFPKTRRQLSRQDVIVLAGSRELTLRKEVQTELVHWVKAGGGLLITGNVLSLDQEVEGFHALKDILPVSLEQRELLEAVKGAVLAPGQGDLLKGLDLSVKPQVYWINGGVTPKASPPRRARRFS
jgi:uncharacterized membrane protein